MQFYMHQSTCQLLQNKKKKVAVLIAEVRLTLVSLNVLGAHTFKKSVSKLSTQKYNMALSKIIKYRLNILFHFLTYSYISLK